MDINRDSGESFFEVLIALSMVTLILTALVSLATVSVRNSTRSKNITLGTRYSQEGIEWLRTRRDASWTNFAAQSAPVPGKTWCISDLNWDFTKQGVCSASDFITGTIMKREANLTTDTVGDPSGNTILANVKTYWTDGQGYHEISTSTDFTPWK